MAAYKSPEGTIEYNEKTGTIYIYRNNRPDVRYKDAEFCQFSMTEEEFVKMIEFFATDEIKKIFNMAIGELSWTKTEMENILKKINEAIGVLNMLEGGKKEGE